MEITPNALQNLRPLLNDESPTSAIRITITPGCCSGPKPVFTLTDSQADNDKVISFDGIKFIIDPIVFQNLSGYIIDYNVNGFKLDFMLPQGRCCR